MYLHTLGHGQMAYSEQFREVVYHKNWNIFWTPNGSFMHVFIIGNKVDYVVTYLIFKLFNGTERLKISEKTKKKEYFT